MTRGTFANIRLKNQLAPGTEGGFTTDYTTGQVSSIYDASVNYKASNIPWSSSRARTTAWAAAATGPPRAPSCWA